MTLGGLAPPLFGGLAAPAPCFAPHPTLIMMRVVGRAFGSIAPPVFPRTPEALRRADYDMRRDFNATHSCFSRQPEN